MLLGGFLNIVVDFGLADDSDGASGDCCFLLRSRFARFQNGSLFRSDFGDCWSWLAGRVTRTTALSLGGLID